MDVGDFAECTNCGEPFMVEYMSVTEESTTAVSTDLCDNSVYDEVCAERLD